VRIESRFAGVGVLPDNDVATSILSESRTLGSRGGTPVASIVSSAPQPPVICRINAGRVAGVVGADIDDGIDTEPGRRVQPDPRTSDHNHRLAPRSWVSTRSAQPHRSGALDHGRVTEGDLRPRVTACSAVGMRQPPERNACQSNSSGSDIT